MLYYRCFHILFLSLVFLVSLKLISENWIQKKQKHWRISETSHKINLIVSAEDIITQNWLMCIITTTRIDKYIILWSISALGWWCVMNVILQVFSHFISFFSFSCVFEIDFWKNVFFIIWINTEKFQYLHKYSDHPSSNFKSFTKGEGIRILRNTSNPNWRVFEDSMYLVINIKQCLIFQVKRLPPLMLQ
jgi:hypothetical protein